MIQSHGTGTVELVDAYPGTDYTNWELKTVLEDAALRAKTVFYSPSEALQKLLPDGIRIVFP